MAVVGLIVLVIAGLFLLGSVIASGEQTTFEFFGLAGDMTVGQAVLIGAIAGFALALGLALLATGAGASARKRRDLKRSARSGRDADDLRAENERLHARLDGWGAEPAATDDAHLDTYPDETAHRADGSHERRTEDSSAPRHSRRG